MIDGNTLKFGYGDLCIGSLSGLMLQIIPFKPPLEIGTACNEAFENGDIETTGDPIYIKFTKLQDFKELRQKLKDVCTNKIFEFKGYTFDFSNYNEKSVDVVKRKLKDVYETYLRLAAC